MTYYNKILGSVLPSVSTILRPGGSNPKRNLYTFYIYILDEIDTTTFTCETIENKQNEVEIGQYEEK